MSFQTHDENGLVYLTSDILSEVRHGFSTRKGGVSAAPPLLCRHRHQSVALRAQQAGP